MYHSMSITWGNKMIEGGINYVDSTIKEMTDFFEIRVENLEPKEEKKYHQQLPRNPTRKDSSRANKKTLTPVS